MALENAKSTLIAAALSGLRKRATLARVAYSDLSGVANAADQGDTIRINRVVKPSSSNAEMAKPGTMNVANPTLDKVDLVLNRWRRVWFDISDKDAHDTMLMQWVAMARTYGQVLADELEAYLFQRVLERVPYNNGVAGTTPFSASLGDFRGARKAISKRDGLDYPASVFVNPDAADNLLGLDDFISADKRGTAAEMTGLTGDLGTRFGFSFFESNNIPTITRGGAGNFAINGAGAIKGATSFAVDGITTAVNSGEIVTIGGKDYAVAEKITGGSGTLVVDRGLEAQAADNAAVTRKGTHAPNVAMVNSALVFAMRPVAPPQVAGGQVSNVMPLVDPETGFSLTLEVSRIEHGTRYVFSALYGATVVETERLQRILG